jgi:asparagine N-glycosylation enzyme membrane subunit Stt3
VSRTVTILFVLLAAALALRCRFIGDVFLEGHVLPYDPDSSYHLWRIEDAVRHHGVPPRFDAFVNAPEGARVILPDGFDAALALPPLLLAGPDASRWDVQVAALAALPILGVLALLALYLLVRRAYGGAAAVVAVALGAVLPAHVDASFLGRVDHHVLEIGLPALALALALGAADPASAGRRRLRAAGVGAAVGALAYGVPVALLHVGAIAFAVTVASLRAARLGDARAAGAMLAAAGWGMALAAAALVPDALGRHGFAYYEPSWLGPSALAGAALAAVALSAAARRGFRPLLAATLALGVATAAAAAFLFRDAAGYLGRQGLLALIGEAQPLWSSPWEALEVYSLALPVVPLLWAALAWRGPPAAWGMAAFGLVGFALACVQGRFGVFLAVPAAGAMAAAIVEAWRRSGRVGRALVALAAVGALVPSGLWLARARLLDVKAAALLDASEWLARHTPPPATARSSHAPAEPTVLTMWGDGSHVAYLADRPVVVAELFHGDYGRGLDDAVRALYGDDPAPILDRRRVGWIVLAAQDASVERAHRAILGLGPAERPPLFSHLYDFDGASVTVRRDGGAEVVPALGDLRLVHDSPYVAGGAPAAKVYERVAGATLVGACAGPGVRARVRVTSDAGRTFDFVSAGPCADGAFRVRVPYAGTAEVLRAPGAAPAAASVAEDDVVAGRDVAVP